MSDIVIHPSTGEVLSLDAPLEDLARWLSEARELDRQMRVEKQRVVDELLERMDREATYALRAGDLELKADGPTIPTAYDAPALHETLREYVEAGVITEDALERAVAPQPVTYKARAQGLKALEKLGGGIVDAIQRHAQPKEDFQRRVSVKPAGELK